MAGELSRYHVRSRNLSVGLLSILPLLAIYEIGILVTGSRVQNHAGLLVRRMIRWFGMDAYLVLTAGVAVTFLIALWRKRRGPHRDFGDYGVIVAESMFYAAVLGPLVTAIQAGLPQLAAGAGETAGRGMRLLLFVGAGVWEELVFRLLLLGGLVWVFSRGRPGARWIARVLGVIVSATLFALLHHVGALGEPFRAELFIYRTLAGVVLGTLFLIRGLGVTVYTHVFYNVGLFLLRGGGG